MDPFFGRCGGEIHSSDVRSAFSGCQAGIASVPSQKRSIKPEAVDSSAFTLSSDQNCSGQLQMYSMHLLVSVYQPLDLEGETPSQTAPLQNLFCRDEHTFAWRKIEPKNVKYDKGRKLVFGECRHRFSFNSDASAPNAFCKLLCNCIALHCTTTLHNGQGGTFTTAVQAGEWLKVCGELARHCTESSSADKLFSLFFTLHHLQPIVTTLLVLLLGPSLYTTFSQTSGRMTPVNVGPE